MEPPSPDPSDSVPVPDPAPAGRSSGLRLAGVLLLAGLVAMVGWNSMAPPAPATGPASVAEYVLQGIRSGDGSLLWGVMTPRARETYGSYLRGLRKNPEGPEAVRFRTRVGVSREDLQRQGPETLLRRENEALAEEFYRLARVTEVRERGSDEALLILVLGNAEERTWLVKRIEGAWKVDDLSAVYNQVTGDLLSPR